MKNTLHVLAAAVFALQAVPVRSGELESSFDGAMREIVRKNADRLAQAHKVEGIRRAFRLEKKELLDKLDSLGFSVSAEEKRTIAVRKFGPAPGGNALDRRPSLTVRIGHDCEDHRLLAPGGAACSLGDAVVFWYDTAVPLPEQFQEHWQKFLLATKSLPELKAKTENYTDFERLVAALEKRYFVAAYAPMLW